MWGYPCDVTKIVSACQQCDKNCHPNFMPLSCGNICRLRAITAGYMTNSRMMYAMFCCCSTTRTPLFHVKQLNSSPSASSSRCATITRASMRPAFAFESRDPSGHAACGRSGHSLTCQIANCRQAMAKGGRQAEKDHAPAARVSYVDSATKFFAQEIERTLTKWQERQRNKAHPPLLTSSP